MTQAKARSKTLKASIITTERNEVDAIKEFIESILSQSVLPDEIVIADGGSTDGTLEVIRGYIDSGAPIKLVIAPGNRSKGRNAATREAKNEIIACTDVGSRLDKNWFKNITRPLFKNPKAMVVSGFFLPEPKTFFENVSATLMLNPNEKIDINTWLPSSRSIAYRKEAWEKAGGYPEYTNFNEDTPFDLALKKQGYKFEDGLDAIVYWRPRPNFKEFFRQYYYYALGDGIDNIDGRHFRKLTLYYLAVIGIAALSVILGIIFLVIVIFVFLGRVFLKVRSAWVKIGGLRALLLMMALSMVFDLSQIFGYWNGYLNRNKLKGSSKLVR